MQATLRILSLYLTPPPPKALYFSLGYGVVAGGSITVWLNHEPFLQNIFENVAFFTLCGVFIGMVKLEVKNNLLLNLSLSMVCGIFALEVAKLSRKILEAGLAGIQ